MIQSWPLLKIVLFIVVFIIVASLAQFILSIHPPRYYESKTPEDYLLAYENVSFNTSDGINIKGWLLRSKKANGTVIVGHGYPFDKGNIFPVAKFLYPDYHLLFYDHRYFGESEGRITTGGFKEVKDVEAAVRFVKKRFDKKPIALYGFSLSGAAMLLAQPNVQAIISDSSYADLERLLEGLYRLYGPLKWPFVKVTEFFGWLFLGVTVEGGSPAKAVQGSKIPTLVIHGDKDTQISVESAHTLKKSNPQIELWIVKGADHGEAYALHPKEYEKRVKDFLKKHMK